MLRALTFSLCVAVASTAVRTPACGQPPPVPPDPAPFRSARMLLTAWGDRRYLTSGVTAFPRGARWPATAPRPPRAASIARYIPAAVFWRPIPCLPATPQTHPIPSLSPDRLSPQCSLHPPSLTLYPLSTEMPARAVPRDQLRPVEPGVHGEGPADQRRGH